MFDIGNTRTKLGVFDAGIMIKSEYRHDQTAAQLADTAQQEGVQRILVSSVAEPDPSLIPTLREVAPVTELTADTPLPFVNLYTTPKTLGKDRLAAVAGAQALFPRQHCLVVDCGTCIKFEYLDATGHYHGGNIAPGLSMRIRAMHEFTARLPEVPLEMPENTIGNSTTTALQNGALRGAVLEIEGFYRLFSLQSDDQFLQVILTGGDANFLVSHLVLPSCAVEPNLTLIGLNAILTMK